MKKKRSSASAKPSGQFAQALKRRAKAKRRRPANDLLKGGPNLDKKAIRLPQLGVYGNSFPLTFGTAPRRKRLKAEATDGERCHATFTQDTVRFRVGEIVILNKKGMTIHIPADPDKRVRGRRLPLK